MNVSIEIMTRRQSHSGKNLTLTDRELRFVNSGCGASDVEAEQDAPRQSLSEALMAFNPVNTSFPSGWDCPSYKVNCSHRLIIYGKGESSAAREAVGKRAKLAVGPPRRLP